MNNNSECYQEQLDALLNKNLKEELWNQLYDWLGVQLFNRLYVLLPKKTHYSKK